MDKLKKVLVTLKSLLPHLLIAMSVVLISFFVLDRFNRAMSFINNNITKWMIAVYCGLVVLQAILYIIDQRKGRGK